MDASDVLTSPELRAGFNIAKRKPLPKVVLNYIRARFAQKKHGAVSEMVKLALATRPIDDIQEVATLGTALAGVTGGSRLAAMALSRAPVKYQLAGRVIGGIAGNLLAQAAKKRFIDSAVNQSIEDGSMPESLTYVDLLSKNQSRLSDAGFSAGVASGVPVGAYSYFNNSFAKNLAKDMGPALSPVNLAAMRLVGAIPMATTAVVVGSKLGNAVGNIMGYYRDKKEGNDE